MAVPDLPPPHRPGALPVPVVPGYALRAPVPGSTRAGEGQWQAVRLGDREAVRVVTLPLPQGRAQALERVAEVAAVRRRGLVPVRDAVPCGEGLALVLGWQARTRLSRVLARRVRFTEAEVAGLLTELGALLTRLHREGVVHGGLSAAEVWLEESGRVVLGDLALQAVRPRPGPVPAPELAEGFACSPDSDVWDLAVLARTCLDGRPPSPEAAVARSTGAGGGSELRELLTECLAADPARRPAAEEVAGRAPETVRRPARVWQGPAWEPPEQAPGGADRRGPRVRLVLLSVLVGATATVGAVLHGQGTSGSAQQQDAGNQVAGAAATTTAPPTGVATGPTAATPTGAATGPATGPPTAAGPARPDPPPTAAPAEAPPSSVGAVPGTGTAVDAGAGEASPVGDLLQDLLAARAAAWQDPDPRALADALAPGSPALEHDRAALAEAAAMGVAYPGLGFAVEHAELVGEQPGRWEVEAEVTRAAYRITGGPAGKDGVAEPAQRHTVRVVLTGADGRWRIHDWQPVEAG